MKKRIVKVAVHKVFGLDAQNAITVPRHFPDEVALETYLNEVYGRQVNTFFDVTLYDEKGPAQTGIDFDFAGDTNDLKLNTNSPNDPELSAATPNAKSQGTNPSANIDVWVIGGGVLLIEGNGWLYGRQLGGEGVGKAIVDGDLGGVMSTPVYYTKFLHHVIAHEIGHVMIGDGHPDLGEGRAVLFWRYQTAQKHIAGPRDKERLMCSGDNTNFYNLGKQLIKKEWDQIEEWLNANVKDDPE